MPNRKNIGTWLVMLSVKDGEACARVNPGQYIITPLDGGMRSVLDARQFHEGYDILEEDGETPAPKADHPRGKAAAVVRPGVSESPEELTEKPKKKAKKKPTEEAS